MSKEKEELKSAVLREARNVLSQEELGQVSGGFITDDGGGQDVFAGPTKFPPIDRKN